jgi:hypothetical protein
MKEAAPKAPGQARAARSDVFISYAREDQDFVRSLHNALAEQGRNSWVDWQGIPPTAEWMAEVKAAIEAADSFWRKPGPVCPLCWKESASSRGDRPPVRPTPRGPGQYLLRDTRGREEESWP